MDEKKLSMTKFYRLHLVSSVNSLSSYSDSVSSTTIGTYRLPEVHVEKGKGNEAIENGFCHFMAPGSIDLWLLILVSKTL